VSLGELQFRRIHDRQWRSLRWRTTCFGRL
jgi:hypothetical protein